jgi:hypothetical protein
MPDWMSHIIIVLIFSEVFNIRKKSLLVFGSLLPDFLSKLHLFFFYFGLNDFLSFGFFHTPVVSILVGVIVASLFKYNRVKTTVFIIFGVISHFLADLTMKHFHSGMLIYFPFSFKVYTFNLIWPEQSIYVLIVSFIVYVIIRIVKKINLENRGLFNLLK